MHGLDAEIEASSDAQVQALLHYEVAGLYEQRLNDLENARERYTKAADLWPEFRPAHLALLRIAIEHDEGEALARAWKRAETFAPTTADRALARVEHGLVLDEQLDDLDGAVDTWVKALREQPDCQAAALLLERHYRSVRNQAEADDALAARARVVRDAGLRAALWLDLGMRAAHASEALAELADVDANVGDAALRLELACELARGRARWPELARAFEARAGLLAAGPEAAALLLSASRVAAGRMKEPTQARVWLDRAIALDGEETLLALEDAALCRSEGNHDAERARVQQLVDAAGEGVHGALLLLRLAQLEAERGEAGAALEALRRAHQWVPEAAVPLAKLEDAYSARGLEGPHRAHLLRRASEAKGAAASERFWQALHHALACGALDEAAELLERWEQSGANGATAAREHYHLARLRNDKQALSEHAERLAALTEDDVERSALTYERFLALRDANAHEEAHKLLEASLEAENAKRWAPAAARVQALVDDDIELLARAHTVLAAGAGDAEARAAHGTAAARAWLRAGDADRAIASLRAALRDRPGDTYAISLLEETLLARGDVQEAARVLRDATQERAQREQSLSRAGAAAEAAGDDALAVSSYQEIVEGDAHALGALWALRRIAERTGDETLLLRALEGLAEREEELGARGTAQLELGEMLDVAEKPDAAAEALGRALDDPAVRTAAAVDVVLLPPSHVAVDTWDAALAELATRAAGESLRGLARERHRRSLYDQPNAIGDVPAVLREDIFGGWVALCRARSAEAQAQAWERLAARVGGETHSELDLCARRAAALAGQPQQPLVDTDASGRHALAAIDEAESTGAAEERAGALFARLARLGDAPAPGLRIARARALLEAGRAREAVDVARRLIEHSVDDLAAWEVLLAASLAIDDPHGVIEAADRLAEHCEGGARAGLLSLSAHALAHDLGSVEQAEARLRAAIEADRGREDVFVHLHDLLVQRGDLSALARLIDDRLAVIEDAEEQVDLLYERALLDRARGDREGALAMLADLRSIESHEPRALALAVEIHSALGQWREAVEALRAVATADVPAAQQRLARLGAADFLDRRLDEPAAAYAELRELAVIDDSLEGLAARMGRLAERAGMEDEAIAAYERALAMDPRDVDSAAGLGRLQRDSRALERALTAARKRLLEGLAHEPADPERLRALASVCAQQRASAPERAALDALVALGLASEEERRRRDDLRAASGGESVTLHQEQLDALRTPSTEGPAAEALSIVATALGPPPALRGNLPPAEMRFTEGQRAMAAHMGVATLMALDPADREGWVDAALAFAGRAGTSPPAVVTRAHELERRLDRGRRRALSAACGALGAPREDLQAALASMERACLRAGLLAAGELDAAFGVLLGRRRELEGVLRSERAMELLRYAVLERGDVAGEGASP